MILVHDWSLIIMKICCWGASKWVRASTVRPILLWNRRPHSKTRKSLERTNVWSWATKDWAGWGQQKFTELNCKTSNQDGWSGYASYLHAGGALFDSRQVYRLSWPSWLKCLKHNWTQTFRETGSVCVLWWGGGKSTTLLGLSEKANLSHWTTYVSCLCPCHSSGG